MDCRIFHPTSSQDFIPGLAIGQRYRHTFGDTRLSRRYVRLLNQMAIKQSVVIHQLCTKRREQAGFYRFVNNSRVKLEELIHENCHISEGLVKDRDILILQDSTAVSLRSKLKSNRTRSGVIFEPLWCTVSPKTSRSA